MNRFFSLLSAVMLVAACNGQKFQKAPITAPDRTNRHSGTICPNWNDTFIGQTSNRQMQIRMSADSRGAMLLEDLGMSATWVIDGKGHPRSGFPGESYVAYCTSSTTTNGKMSLAAVGTLIIEAYDGSSQLLFKITYIPTSTGFNYSDVDENNQPLEPAEEFKKK